MSKPQARYPISGRLRSSRSLTFDKAQQFQWLSSRCRVES